MKPAENGTADRDLLQRYLKDVAASKPLSSAEEAALAARIRAGDRAARDKLVEANLRFVVRVAREYQNRDITLADLISAGNLGLITAAERFDASRGVKFITYAVWWIRQSILHTLTEHARTVRLPSNRLELLQRISRCMDSRKQESPNSVPVDEIARDLDISEAQVVDVLESGQPILSLDTRLQGDDEYSMLDLMMDENQEPPDSQVMRDFLKQDINSVLNTLEAREAEVLRLYFGLDADEDMTLEAIGDSFGLTRERVRQIKERALNKLRHPMQVQRLVPYAEGF